MADGWHDVSAPTGCPWELLAPGPLLAQALASVEPATLKHSERVSYLAASERLAGWVHVVQAHALVAVSDAVKEVTANERGSASMQQSWVADEIAAVLHIAPRTATIRAHAGAALVRDWPVLGQEVAAGRLTLAQAREIYEGVSVLSGTVDDSDEDLSEVAVADLIRIARDLPPARLRERVARMVASLDPAAAARRRERAERDNTDVTIWAEPDGMACLAARGPALDAVAVRELIDARAKDLRAHAATDDSRSLGQWRHAALLAAFGLSPVGRTPSPSNGGNVSGPDATDGSKSGNHPSGNDPSGNHPSGNHPSGNNVTCEPGARVVVDTPRVQIRVTVPLTTLLGLTDAPGELEGYGPLDPDLVRILAADAEWTRWVTDPVGDYLLDSGTRRFPGARLARFLRDRESRCKHPSCGVRARNCDADHLPEHSRGGRTSAAGMSPTCPRHNRHREASGWHIEPERHVDPHGPPDPTWISPLGRRYATAVPTPLALDYIPLRT